MPYAEPVRERVVILGAGPCGLGIARQLSHEHGIDALVVDRADAPASTWRRRPDGFRLNTCGFWSHLPGRHIPRRLGRWPRRDDLVQYFTDYARGEGLRLALGVTVRRVDRHGAGWQVATDHLTVNADAAVIALGNYRTPTLPQWRGADGFTGQLLHADDYRCARPFAGRDVLVVGSGNSATDIALQLCEGGAARVRMAVRTPPHLVPRAALGIPVDAFGPAFTGLPVPVLDTAAAAMRRIRFGNLEGYGLRRPDLGMYTALSERYQIPTLGDALIPRVKAGDIEICSAVAGFDRDRVLLSDATAVTPEVVITATGYTPDLTPIVGHLDVLDSRGAPRADGPAGVAPGLWCAGYSEPLIGPLRYFRRQASPIAAAVARHVA